MAHYLTEADVIAIRNEIDGMDTETRETRIEALADKYPVPAYAIREIANRSRWSYFFVQPSAEYPTISAEE